MQGFLCCLTKTHETYVSRKTGVSYSLYPKDGGVLLYVDGVLQDKNVRSKGEALQLIELDDTP